jgi:hypothetical protein
MTDRKLFVILLILAIFGWYEKTHPSDIIGFSLAVV